LDEQRTRYVARIPKGYRTMLATHHQVTGQVRNRLKTTAMGLGLVRLLQDARRFEEARTTLCSLDDGFQGVAQKAAKPSQESRASSTTNMLFGESDFGTNKQEMSDLQIAVKLEGSHLSNVEWQAIR
jgi:hypothetical protein